MREVQRALQALDYTVDSLNDAFMSEPDKNHDPALALMQANLDKLATELDASNLLPTHSLREEAKKVTKKCFLLQAKLTKPVMPDVKPVVSTERSKGGYKVATLSVPKFSGQLKDWHPFWNAFRETIHDTKDFSKTVKLSYFREAMKDKDLWRRLGRSMDDENYYDEAVKELQAKFDKPREMHRAYLRDVTQMGKVQPTKAALNKCADILRDSLDGLTRLKQTDITFILTSVAVDFLPPRVANAWAEKTESSKAVPSVVELIEFLKLKAEQPWYTEKSTEPS